MFRQIYNKRRDWESAPFYPNPRADYEKARNIVQNVGRWIFELRSNFQEGIVAGQSKAEIEMETSTPLPIPGPRTVGSSCSRRQHAAVERPHA